VPLLTNRGRPVGRVCRGDSMISSASGPAPSDGPNGRHGLRQRMLEWEDQMRRWLFATLAVGLVGLAAGASCPETQAAGPAASGRRNADASFEWIYSCTNGKGCAFNCAGVGLAMHVTKLTVRLRRLEIGNQNALALFYDYSTMEVPSGNGFSINTGLGTLSCQVNGMKLDYFGPPTTQLQD
jgi:hypothetical protein